MKFGICSEIFRNWDIEKTLSYVSETGYDGVEIAPFVFCEHADGITRDERKRIKTKALENKLEIIGLHWLLVSPEGLSLSSPDGRVRDKTADYLCVLASLCSDIGGKYLVLGSPKQRAVPPGSSRKETWSRVKAALRRVLTFAEDRGVELLIEPLSENETNFINTAAEAVEFIEDMNHPSLGLHLDVKAMSCEEKPVPQIIREAKEHLRHFHANDPNLKGPGFGETDYRPIRDALAEAAYDAYLSVEVFDFSPGPEKTAEKSLEYLKSIFGTPEGGNNETRSVLPFPQG